VLFDLDGTLANSTEAHIAAWLKSLEYLGISRSRELLTRLMGLSSIDIARKLLPPHMAERAEELADIKDGIFMKEMVRLAKPVLGAREVVLLAKRLGMKCGVVSMNPRRVIIQILDTIGLLELMDVIVGTEDVERGKPAPDPILEACMQLGVNPREAVYIGDSVYDVQAATAAGAVSVLIGSPRAGVRPHFAVGSLKELIHLLGRLKDCEH